MNNVKDKIYKLRKEHGLSQEELGFEIGVSRQTISKWELGTAEPDLKNLMALCQHFKIDLDYFLSDNNFTPIERENEEAITYATQEPEEEKPKPKNLLKYKFGIIAVSILIVASIVNAVYFAINLFLIVDLEPEDVIITEQNDFNSYWILSLFILISIVLICSFIVLLIKFIKKRGDKQNEL